MMIIYKATNTITNKSYIGRTINTLNSRMTSHKHSAKKGSKQYFHRSIRKYGWDAFIWETICECNTERELDEMEFHYIKQFNTLGGGYNLTEGYDNTTTGYKFTPEQCKHRSIITKGERNPNYGNGDKIRGDINPAKRPEVREKIRQSKLGVPRPDVAESKSKRYLIHNTITNESMEIKNLTKWCRDNPKYNRTGMKNVLSGKIPNHHGLVITLIG